jgi:predicted nucleic acid-binding protein
VPLTIETYHKAVKIRGDYTLSFWDSLIVASALENDANILFSEDMHNGLRVRKKLTIQNPFILK